MIKLLFLGFFVWATVALWKGVVPGAKAVPWGMVGLLALGCIGWRIEGSQVGYGGLPATTVILGVVGVFFLVQVAGRVERLLVRADLLAGELDPKYGILLPLASAFAMVHIEAGGQDAAGWRVTWGDPEYSLVFLFVLWVVVSLGRILRALRAAESEFEGC
jgi:hypothetical protein